MNPTDRDPKEIFLAALDHQSPEALKTFLDDACGSDAAVRQRVEELLAAYEKAGNFLGGSASLAATVDMPAPGRLPFKSIGPYKLLQQIGEGGMGSVFMAEQTEPIHRKVALKLIKPGMDTRQTAARFEAERQALALMEHQNIAKVLDAGTTATGQPFFVMELVHGIPITKYCDQQKLSPRQRLELFIPVCQAVQHAHQKGVIHRDLKPSNILVAIYDGQPVPKVIDFGVAKTLGQKLTDKTMFTEFGSIVGTLEYMSPEQAEQSQLDVDTRSDIYSLGVILYELLTGTTPLDRKNLKSAAILELLRVIKEEEPPKPSTRLSTTEALPSIAANRSLEPKKLSGLLRGELDWIVMKALEKDRNRRYETANGFAADVQRYLHDEPVAACPPSTAYRLRKLVRRNKSLVAGVCAVMAVLTVGMVTSTLLALRAMTAEGLADERLVAETNARNGETDARRQAETERDKALTAERRAERERDRAEEGFAQASATVNQYLTQVSESHLLKAPGMQPLRRELLQSALTFYEDFLRRRGDDPSILTDLADTSLRLRQVYQELGMPTEEKAALLKAQQLYEKLLATDSDNSELLFGLANCYYYGYRERLKGVEILESLLQKHPERDDFKYRLAETCNVLAFSTLNKDDRAEQLRLQQRALVLKEDMVRRNPANLTYRESLGITLFNLGYFVRGTDADESFKLYRRALDELEFVYVRNPNLYINSTVMANCHFHFGFVLASQEKDEESETAYRRALDVQRKLAIENPAIPGVAARAAVFASTLSQQQRKMGKADEAKTTALVLKEFLDRQPKETSIDQYNLACFHAVYSAALVEGKQTPTDDELWESKQQAELAMQALQLSLDRGLSDFKLISMDKDWESLRGREDFQAIQAQVEQRFQLAELTKSQPGMATGDTLQAQNRTLEIRRQQAAKDPSNINVKADLAQNQHVIGLLQYDLKQWELAAASFDEARKLRIELVQRDAKNIQYLYDLASTLGRIAAVSERVQQPGAASDAWNEQRKILESLHRQQSNDSKAAIVLSEAHYFRGYGLWRADRYSAALPHWDEGYQILHRESLKLTEDSTLRQAIASRELLLAEFLANRGFLTLAMAHGARIPPTERYLSARSESRMTLLFAALGLRDEYEQSCRMLMERFANDEPYYVAEACSLLPGCPVPAERTLEVANEAARRDGKNTTWVQVTLSRAQIRAGKYADAAKSNSPFLNAIIEWQRGGKDSARSMLQFGEAQFVEMVTTTLRGLSGDQSLPSTLHSRDYSVLIQLRQARREAWELIEGKVPLLPAESLVDTILWTRIGNQPEADKALQTAMAHVPAEPQSLAAFASTMVDLGHSKWAIEAYNSAVQRHPQSVELWLARARYHLRQGDHAAADADFMQAAKLSPNELQKFVEEGWWASANAPDASGWITPDPVVPAQVDASPEKPKSDPNSWRLVPPLMWEGEVKLRGSSGLKSAQTVYGVAYVYSTEAKAVTLLVGGYVPLELKLNGRLIYRWKSYSTHYNLDRVPVLLQPGRNTLVVQLTGPAEDRGIIFRIGDTPLDRGLEFAYLGVWDQALPLLKTAFAEDPQQLRGANSWQFYAKALFQSGDLAGYQELRGEALDWAPKRATADTYLQVSSLCSLAPLSADEAARVVQLVDDGVAKASSYKASWMTDNQTVVYHRAGRYQEVLDRVGTRGGSTWSALRALCHHHLGNANHAKTELKLADSQRRNMFMMGPNGAATARVAEYRHGILDTTTDYALIREARTLIAPDGPAEDAVIEAWRAAVRQQLDAADPRLLPFELSLIYDFKNPHRWLERGRARAELGDWNLAQEDFQKAVALAPADPEVLAARVRAYADLKHFDEAATDVLMLRDEKSELAKAANWSDVTKQLESDLPQWPALVERLKPTPASK